MEKTGCVTGAGGYIASWVVLKLLQKGYIVHGTLRNPADEKKCGHLNKLPGAAHRLKLFKADLLDYGSLLPAIRGCVGVFHTACPVAPKFENSEDVLGPAVQGTQNVMTACHRENVQGVVFTSSGAAVAFDPKRPKDKVVDESCWSDIHHCKENQLWYSLAKTQSEKLAWDLAKEYNIRLVVVCPVLVLGPVLQSTTNTSIGVVTRLVDGSQDAYSDRAIPVVDVRDVAETHLAAFENPAAAGRYWCAKETASCGDMLRILKKHFPHLSYPSRCVGEAEKGFEFSNEKVLRDLIKEFTPFEKTLVDLITSLEERGLMISSS